MFVSDINNRPRVVNFGAKLRDIKAAQTSDAVVYLKGELASQVNYLITAFNSVYSNLRKLATQTENSKAQSLLSDIKTRLGICEVFDSRAEGIAFDYGEKRMLLSAHGSTGFRIRQQDVKSGKFDESLFVRDKKIAKSDTRLDIPEKIEFYQHNDVNMDEFEKNIQSRVSSADLVLLRLRRAVEAPEVLEEIKNAEPVATAPTVVAKSAVPVIKTSALKKLPSQADYNAIFAAQKAAKAYVQKTVEVGEKPQKTLAERINEKMNRAANLSLRHSLKRVPDLTPPVSKPQIQKKDVSPKVELLHDKIDGLEVKDKKEKKVVKAASKQVEKVKKTASRTKSDVVEVKKQRELKSDEIRRGPLPKGAVEAPAGKIEGVTSVFNSIFERYAKFKKVFANAGVPRRRKILQMADFETKRGYPALIMKKVGDENETLHVSFPLFDGKKALKIFVLDKADTLKKIFYIEDEQMVRINKDEGLSARLHKDRKKRYLSQEEVDNSDIKMYLEQVNLRMEKAVNATDTLKAQKNVRFFGKRSTDAGKSFLAQINKDLKKFNEELTAQIEQSTVDVSTVVKQEFDVLQQNTSKAIEEIKQRLMVLLQNKN